MGTPTEKNKAVTPLSSLCRYLPVALVVSLGIALSLVAFNVTRGRGRARLETKLGRRVSGLVVAIQRGVDRHLEALRAISGLFYASKEVERREFSAFAMQILSPNMAVQALEWAPQVRDYERVTYETAAKKEGWAGFQFTERDEQGRMVRAAARAEHYPVYYVVPLEGNEAAVGFDLASEPTRLRALQEARDSGEMTVTERIKLVQETGEQYSVMAAHPIYRKGVSHNTLPGRRENIAGFTIGVFRIADIVEASLKDSDVSGFDLRLIDETAPAGRSLLYAHNESPQAKGSPYGSLDRGEAADDNRFVTGWTSRMDVGGRQWSLVFHPTVKLLSQEGTWRAWGVLSVGLLFTMILGLYLLDTFRRGAKIEVLASELSEANVALNGANRALTALSQFNRALVHAEDEASLVQEACRVISDVAGYRLAWVGYAAQDEEKSIHPVAQWGFEAGYLDVLDLTWADDERGSVPSARAIRTGEPQVVRHIQTDPVYKLLRDEATMRGYASTIALPLSDGAQAFGVLRVYASEPDAFSEDEVELLSEMAADLEYGILALRTRAQKKRAEEQLRKLSLAIEQSPTTVVITDPLGVIEYVNPKFSQVTGYSLEEAVGQKPSVLKSGRMPPEVYEEMWSTITAGGEWRGELLNKKKNGELYWDFASISSIKDDRGNITHYIAVKENITERKRSEEEIKKANEELRQYITYIEKAQEQLVRSEKLAAVGQLTAGVTHEILNPLGVITMGLHMMLKDPETPSKIAEDLELFKEQANRIIKISQNLLYFARQHPPERSHFDLKEAVERTIDLLKHDLRLKNIEAELVLDEELPEILGDKDQIYQVVLNLLTNARDAVGEGGRVDVITQLVENNGRKAVELRVEDSGPGIDPEHMTKLFDPFFTTKPEGQGTGLGLSICQGIIESHGGAIWAENGPDGGAAFVVRLNVEDE